MREHEGLLIEARDLVVTFGPRTIVDGVDFALRQGEIAVVRGASGCGKSTFLRALASLQPLTRGTITLDDGTRPMPSPTAYRRRVGYVPQTPVMFAGTVADNVRAGPRLCGLMLTDDDVANRLHDAALDPALASRSARELSGGEKQRLAIARALALDPAVLLVDEPTSALDPETSLLIVTLMQRCASDGRGVVVVTHQIDVAVALGGTRYTYAKGRVTREVRP